MKREIETGSAVARTEKMRSSQISYSRRSASHVTSLWNSSCRSAKHCRALTVTRCFSVNWTLTSDFYRFHARHHLPFNFSHVLRQMRKTRRVSNRYTQHARRACFAVILSNGRKTSDKRKSIPSQICLRIYRIFKRVCDISSLNKNLMRRKLHFAFIKKTSIDNWLKNQRKSEKYGTPCISYLHFVKLLVQILRSFTTLQSAFCSWGNFSVGTINFSLSYLFSHSFSLRAFSPDHHYETQKTAFIFHVGGDHVKLASLRACTNMRGERDIKQDIRRAFPTFPFYHQIGVNE